MGDIFDRGDDDLRIEEWVHLLAQDAENANGAIYSILGNHEVSHNRTRVESAPLDAERPFAVVHLFRVWPLPAEVGIAQVPPL